MKILTLAILAVASPLAIYAQADNPSIEKAIDAPGKGYREMAGKEDQKSFVKEALDIQSQQKRIEELENENSLLKKQLEELKLDYKKKIDFINSLDTSILRKQNSSPQQAEQDAAANP